MKNGLSENKGPVGVCAMNSVIVLLNVPQFLSYVDLSLLAHVLTYILQSTTQNLNLI